MDEFSDSLAGRDGPSRDRRPPRIARRSRAVLPRPAQNRGQDERRGGALYFDGRTADGVDRFGTVRVPGESYRFRSYELHADLADADAFVSVAKMKAHRNRGWSKVPSASVCIANGATATCLATVTGSPRCATATSFGTRPIWRSAREKSVTAVSIKSRFRGRVG